MFDLFVNLQKLTQFQMLFSIIQFNMIKKHNLWCYNTYYGWLKTMSVSLVILGLEYFNGELNILY